MTGGAQALNRVVIDGLAAKPQVWSGCLNRFASTGSLAVIELAKSSEQSFSACLDPQSGLLALRIEQQFGGTQGQRVQRIVLEQMIASRA
jgi:hypothetical protein